MNRAVVAISTLVAILIPCIFSCDASGSSPERPGVTAPQKEQASTNTKQTDFQQLMDFLLPFAKKMLNKQGEFYPFGAAIRASGKPELIAGDPGEGEHPDSGRLASFLWAAMEKEASNGQLRSFGLCVDVTTAIPPATQKADAVKIVLRRTGKPGRDVVVFYHKSASGHVEFDTPVFLLPNSSDDRGLPTIRVDSLE